jgi:hypothetical protein
MLVVVGLVFAVTAFGYGLMALVDVRASAGLADTDTQHPLLAWMRKRGDMALLVELAVLAVLTFAAIGTDSYWDKHAEREQQS